MVIFSSSIAPSSGDDNYEALWLKGSAFTALLRFYDGSKTISHKRVLKVISMSHTLNLHKTKIELLFI